MENKIAKIVNTTLSNLLKIEDDNARKLATRVAGLYTSKVCVEVFDLETNGPKEIEYFGTTEIIVEVFDGELPHYLIKHLKPLSKVKLLVMASVSTGEIIFLSKNISQEIKEKIRNIFDKIIPVILEITGGDEVIMHIPPLTIKWKK